MHTRESLADLLNQTAQDLVDEFLDFRLIHDWPALTKLGSGLLSINLATGRTHHDGRRVEPLHITGHLQLWLRESLAGASLSKTNTQDATLTIRLVVEQYSEQRELDSKWAGNPTRFVGCTADVRCRLAVDAVSGEARSAQTMEWPEPEPPAPSS